MTQRPEKLTDRPLAKCPTGIRGLDDVTEGGLPRGRPTLVAGGAGCGKTVLAMEFLVNGASHHDEPGVLLSFEESPEALVANCHSFGWNVPCLVEKERLALDYLRVNREDLVPTGGFDLDGVFIRMDAAVGAIGAKRLVLDNPETLFAGLQDEATVRNELSRLFDWSRERGLTTLVTCEAGEGRLTRRGLEEYLSDCVISLDHRIENQVSTRRLRVVKYRGSSHETNEFPFLIGTTGVSVEPITAVTLAHPALTERTSSGLPELDDMLGGEGFYRGSTVLVSGSAGTGKTSIGCHFAAAACARGERAMVFSFEESREQLIRNMGSMGLDLVPWVDQGLLEFFCVRPTAYGLERHLGKMRDQVEQWRPSVIVVDPVTNMVSMGYAEEVKSMVVRLINHMKKQGVTVLFTDLVGSLRQRADDPALSSLTDTWIQLGAEDMTGERIRTLQILKARGIDHSHMLREFTVSGDGIRLLAPLPRAGGLLMGAARQAHEARLRRNERFAEERLQHSREALEARIAALQAEFEEERLRFTPSDGRSRGARHE